jgi:hypothetical protein
MITIVGEKYVFSGEREPKGLLSISKLLEPADPAMAESPFEPSLDSICGMQRMFFSIYHASRLCDSFLYSHVRSSSFI